MNDKSTSSQIVAKIKSVTNILVTVSRNPSVDQLAAALALALLLDKMGKHATAVFSGDIPSAINFLEPEKTFESNADSLRDFIISLDKQKADRLRLKSEGDIVKVLITPYRTTISEADLSFSEGNFNVEFVLAIGVDKKEDLDDAISAHGRIFHDATVATINTDAAEDSLGSISWRDATASSFCEMASSLSESLESKEKPLMDEQIATALLTGVVASTDQFRNEKTSPAVMTLAANLMAKGANQQLISSELAAANEEPKLNSDVSASEPIQEVSAGELSFDHKSTEEVAVPVELARPAGDLVSYESERLADSRSADALATAEAQLTEAELGNISEIEPILPADAAVNVESQLDQSLQAGVSIDTIKDDLVQETERMAQTLSHGTPYVEEDVKNPINASLVNDEAPLSDPMAISTMDISPSRTIEPLPSGPMISAVPSPVGTKPSIPDTVSFVAPSLSATNEVPDPSDALQAALTAAQTMDNTAEQLVQAQNIVTDTQNSTPANLAVDTGLPSVPQPTFDLPPPPPPLPLPEIGIMPPSGSDFSSASQNLDNSMGGLPIVPTIAQSVGENVKTEPAASASTALFPTVDTSTNDPTQYKIPGQ